MNTSPASLRVLMVDDEAPARLRLRDLLAKDIEVAEVYGADNGEEAVRLIQEERPDLVLLDIQMPGLDGLGVVEAIGPEMMPLTVFVTAFDQHAVRAFEANALDYILKPFGDERMQSMLARAKQRLRQMQVQSFGQSLMRAMSALPGIEGYQDRIAIKSDGITRFLEATRIDWIEAAGAYVTLHVGDKEILHRHSLASLLHKLDPHRFVRVHRSVVVNIASIVQLEPLSHGEFEATMKHGGQLRVSRTYRALLERRLGERL
ncbi:MAG: LytTR family DNA-binding domain-containing protein [Steroidobacteraceae bacterium]